MKISDVATVRNSMWLEPDAEPLFDYDGTINLMLRDTVALVSIVDKMREENGLLPMLPTHQHKTDYDDDGWYNIYVDVNELDDGRTSNHLLVVVDSQYADDDHRQYCIELSDDVRKALYQKLDAESAKVFGLDFAALFDEARKYAET